MKIVKNRKRLILIISGAIALVGLMMLGGVVYDKIDNYMHWNEREKDVRQLKNAADKNDTKALMELFRLYANGNIEYVRARSYEIEISRYDSDKRTALSYIERAAKGGDANVQFTLARTYDGWTFPGDYAQDSAKANEWYLKAINNGALGADVVKRDFSAFYGLYKDGVPEDPREAYKYYVKQYKKSPESNKYYAHYIGSMFNDGGLGVRQSYSEAFKWYMKAPGPSSAELGNLYAKGLGVVQDEIMAYAWFVIDARDGYDHQIELRDKMAGKLSKEEITKGRELATELVKKYEL